MGNISPRRLAGLIVAGVLLLAIMVAGFSRVVLTDAAWSDSRTLSATFEAKLPEVIVPGPVQNYQCEKESGPPPHPVKLTWEQPANLDGQNVVYEVSWRDLVVADYKGAHTTRDREFGPFLPDTEVLDKMAELEFTVQARIEGRDQLSEPVKFYVKGPISHGEPKLNCMNPNAYS